MDKKEYIERGALLNFLNVIYEECRLNNDGATSDLVFDVIRHVEDLPAADVVEVRHGEWIESTHWGAWYYDCPFCDDGFATRGRCDTPPNFCSNCGAKLTGAKMDGERKEQT